MAASDANPHQEVLQFLQDLDSIVPTNDPSSGPQNNQKSKQPQLAQGQAPTDASSQDVLSFLSELDAPVAPTGSPSVSSPALKPANLQSSEAKPAFVPSARVTTRPAPLDGQTSLTANESARRSQDDPRTFGSSPLGTSSPLPGSPSGSMKRRSSGKQDTWGWTNIWSQAQKVSGVAAESITKGLESAKLMAEETARAVSTNEKVKGIIQNVNKEQFGKIGNDITRFTQNVVDTIAPPISQDGDPVFAQTITVWFCSEASGAEDLDSLHDFVQSTVNEMWLSAHYQRLCNKISVNSVKHPDPRVVSNLEEAISLVQGNIERLRKLADKGEAVPENVGRSVILSIQPFMPSVKTPFLDPKPHLQYYVALVANDGSNVAASISQSVAVDNDDTFLGKWSKHQRRRVLETVVADVCEEFAVQCQQNAPQSQDS
ncbi:hypothetical protein DFS34DRAFT_591505 [Phlyctochytrium arcticum]|nr:hypothetical protein DFS34DRAFT_591505 [Phlyctochytrium arcticum]